MDRINNDDVFRLNLILNGGWTKDTFHILEGLIELALKQKEWNRRSAIWRMLTENSTI